MSIRWHHVPKTPHLLDQDNLLINWYVPIRKKVEQIFNKALYGQFAYLNRLSCIVLLQRVNCAYQNKRYVSINVHSNIFIVRTFMRVYENVHKIISGADTDHVKVVISHVKLSNLHIIGKYGNEIGEKSGKVSTKSGKIGTFT